MAANTLSLHPRRIVTALSVVAVVLVIASVASQLALHASGHPAFAAVSKLLFVDAERNIPTAFSSLLLLLSALLLAVIAVLKHQRGEAFVLHWSLLSLGFVAMAVDEAMSFHEKLVGPMRNLLGNEDLGIFYFAWVVPAMGLVLVLGLFFLRFLWRLPRRTAGLFVLAAALYLGGALGVELIGGRYAEQHGTEGLAFGMIATVEESLEMAGIIVYLWALLTYLAGHYGEVRLVIAQGSAPAAVSSGSRPATATPGTRTRAFAGDGTFSASRPPHRS